MFATLMIDGVTWAEALTGVGTILIASGVVFAGLQVRDGRKAQQVAIASDLVRTWENQDLVEARKLVDSSFRNKDLAAGIDQLTNDVRTAWHDQTDDWYVYSKVMSFYEQVGVSFCDHRQGRKVVDEMMGGIMIEGWLIWRIVVKRIWPDEQHLMENFRRLAIKLQRQRNKEQARKESFRKFRKTWGIAGVRSPAYFGEPGEAWEYPGKT